MIILPKWTILNLIENIKNEQKVMLIIDFNKKNRGDHLKSKANT